MVDGGWWMVDGGWRMVYAQRQASSRRVEGDRAPEAHILSWELTCQSQQVTVSPAASSAMPAHMSQHLQISLQGVIPTSPASFIARCSWLHSLAA